MVNSDLADGVSRTRRVASLVRRELSEIFLKDLSDPRIGMVTITSIEVSKDLKYAKVCITSSFPEDSLEVSVNTLNHASPYIRRLLGHRLGIKTVPAVNFVADHDLERGERLAKLIDSVN